MTLPSYLVRTQYHVKLTGDKAVKTPIKLFT